MKKRLIFLFLTISLIVQSLHSQTFPVTLVPQVTPPAPIYFSSYANASSINSPLRLQIILNDLSQANREIKLKTYFEGNGISFQSKDVVIGGATLFIEGGIPLTLTNTELSPYFSYENITGIPPATYGQIIPEGSYQFCFEVYDVLTGARISQKTCASTFIFQNEPPLLIAPNNQIDVTEQNPLNLLFQWTPRHINVSNVQYELSIVEIWDQTINPQAAFLASPPVFQTTTTNTSYLYGPANPLFLSNKRYAWRVKAKALNGAEEIGLFKNNGYSEIYWFNYTSPCDTPDTVRHEVKGAQQVNVLWDDFTTDVPEFVVRYREKGNNNEWFTSRTSSNWLTIWDLRPGTTYEYQVLKKCLISESEYSISQTFTTLEESDETSLIDCGISPDMNIENMEPLEQLFLGDIFKAGDFPVKVTETNGSNGRFSGKGYVTFPYFNSIKVAVHFTNVFINNQKQLAEGMVMTVYDPKWGNILDVDEVIDAGEDIVDVFTGGDNDIITLTYDIETSDISIIDGQIVITKPDGTKDNRDYDEGDTYTITDASGDKWTIDKEGNITQTGKGDPSPPLTSANADGIQSGTHAGTIEDPYVDTIINDAVKVAFREHKENEAETRFALDQVNNSFETSTYSKIKTSDGKDYYPPHKAAVQGEDDVFYADIEISDSNINIDSLIIKTVKNSAIKHERLAGTNTYKITVSGINPYQNEECVITYLDSADKKYKIAASFFIHHIRKQKEIPVQVVTVNGGKNIPDFETELNKIYSRAGGNFKVKPNVIDITVAQNSWDENNNNIIDYDGSGILSDYPTELKNIYKEFKKQYPGYDSQQYFVLVLSNEFTVSKPLSGFMPKTRQWGFLFEKHIGSGLEKKDSALKVAAHELGHGVFTLEHPFGENLDNTGKASTWLMDYGDGTELGYPNWATMSDSGLKLFLFQEDSGGENYSTRGYFKDLQFGQNEDSNKTFTFLTPSKEILVLPNNVSNVTKFYGYYGNSLFDDLSKFNQFMTVVPGTIAKFTIEDKTYKARIIELGENEYSLKEYSTDNGEVYKLSDYNIELNEKNSSKAIIFGVHESDKYSYHALIINGNYSHFSENSRIVPVKDFIVQIDAETRTKSLDIQYSGSQYSITNEAVNWVFAEANYSNSDKTFLLRNKILEIKSLYPRLLDEISSQFGNWNRQNLCSGGGKFELLLRQEYCYSQTNQKEGTTSYSIKTDANIPDSAEKWLIKFYDYLKININNEANNIASSLLDYNTIPGKIEEDDSQDIAYVINIASQNDIAELHSETILKIISKFVNETFTPESNSAKYDLEGAIIKLIQYANRNINKPILEGIEGTNVFDPDKVLSEQIFYAVDDAFLFFGSDNRNLLIRELTKKMFDAEELYDSRLSDAIKDIENRSFVFEYTNVVGRALVEIGNITSETLTYRFIDAPLSDYYQTETINRNFITDKNDSNFGKIKLTQLTQSGFRNVTIDDKTKFKVDYSNEEYFKPFDLIFLTNKSNLTSVKSFESGVGFDRKNYPIPAIAVAYVSQSGENQTTADAIFTVIDVASLAVSGGALNIATNLTRAKRIFYTADVISSMASIGATSVSDNAELNELKNILQITSTLSGIVSLGENVSNINFKNLLIKAKNKVDEAEEIASDIRKLSQNINQLSNDQLGVFVSSYEKVTDDYIGYAIKDLQDAKHANDAEAVKQIKQALTKVLDAKSEILQINVKAEQLLSDARRVEEVVTSDISNIASSKGGIMEGLEFRLKTKSSLVRKLFVDGVNTPMNDVLRYTTTFEAESFTDGVFDVMKALQQKGYEIVNVKNTFEGGAVYKGINTNLREPSGQVFELQFHTPKSLDVKQTINHPLYEEYRILDPTTPRAQELFQEMVQNSSKIPEPGNVQNIIYESLKLSGSHLDLLNKLEESSLSVLKNNIDDLDESFKTEFFQDFSGASKDKLQKLQDENLLSAWKENLRSDNLDELLISKTNSVLREEYAAKVEALADKKIELLNEGKSIEEVAKILQEMRRSLTIEYKDYTPSDFLEWIFKRNEITYTQTGKGDKWGATYEGLVKTNAKKKFGIDDLNLLNQSQWNEINESIAKSSSFNFGGTKKELGTNFYDFFTDKVSSSELQELEKILIKYRMR